MDPRDFDIEQRLNILKNSISSELSTNKKLSKLEQLFQDESLITEKIAIMKSKEINSLKYNVTYKKQILEKREKIEKTFIEYKASKLYEKNFNKFKFKKNHDLQKKRLKALHDLKKYEKEEQELLNCEKESKELDIINI